MTTIEKKLVRRGKLVNTEHVDTVIRTYKQERWVQNSDRIGKEDSLSAWFGLEEMEQFIAMAKQHGADGIKVYYAAYPSDFEVEEYRDRQTVVFVGTKTSNTDFGVVNKDIYFKTNDGSSILAFNYGNLCPPFCREKEEGKEGEGGSGIFENMGQTIGLAVIDRGEKGIQVV
ncbi:hypothetical protein [Gynurincola endophyticus]|jgi:hypothetical protein|uniref:hypothetical protein n=1 Tax=Gynurincola endophyticus TaxID=2479004 RepID=UPI000F8C59AE|nr:hypothetical protein [Gynurincola endophyticus]